MKELIKNFLSFGLATTIEKLLLFLLIPIYSFYLTSTELGIIEMLQVIMELASIFSFIQLETSFQRYYYDYQHFEKTKFISSLFTFVTISSILITVLLIIFSKEISLVLFKDTIYSDYISYSSLKLPFSNCSVLLFIILRFENHNRPFFIFILIRVITLLGLMLFLLRICTDPVFSIILAQLLSVAITCLSLFFYTKRYFLFALNKRIMRSALTFSLPMFPARLGSFAVTYANRFFIISLLSLSAIGIYSISLKFASAIQVIYMAFSMAWPQFLFSTYKKENAKEIFKKIPLFVACPTFLIICLITCFSPELISIFSNETYAESANYIGGLSLFFSLLIFKELFDIGPKVKEKTYFITISFFISVAINLITLYIFTKYWGIKGVVISMIITNTVLVISSYVFSNKLYKIDYNLKAFIYYSLPVYAITSYFTFSIPAAGGRIIIGLLVVFFYCFNFIRIVNLNPRFLKN